MALASRSARRGGAGRRWVLIGVVISLFILLIDASLQSRSPGPEQQLAAGAWIDRVLPIVTTSTEEGQQLAGIWAKGLQTPATALSSQLDEIATGAAQAYKQVVDLRPPATVAGSAGLLEACLLTRSEAASMLRGALGPVLLSGAGPPGGTNGPDPVLTAIQTAGDDLQIGDQAYQLFIHSLPKLGVTMPPSLWVSNSTPYQSGAAQVFLTSLRSALSTTPIHEVKIYSLATSPPAVSMQGTTQVLPNSAVMSVTVVVADVGNQAESNLTVTAAISAGGSSTSVRDFVSLTPGQAHTIDGMGPLTPPEGVPVTLTVMVTPPAGSSTPAVTQTEVFMMPGTTAPSTTTVPAGATATTVPAGATTTTSASTTTVPG
jgi:hypothetical protein